MDAIGFIVVVAVAALACGGCRRSVHRRRERQLSELQWQLHASALLAAHGHLAAAAHYAVAALAQARRCGDRACEAIALQRLHEVARTASGAACFAPAVDDC